MYILILRFLRSRRRQSMISFSQSAAAGAAGERRRTSYPSRVFLAVVVVFGVCWLPLHGHLLLVYMGRQPHARWYAVFLTTNIITTITITFSFSSSLFSHNLHYNTLYDNF